MIGNITPTLPEKLVGYLHPGAPALLLSSGADGYSTSAYTWALGLDDKRLRFAVDVGGSSMANLQRSGQASVQIRGALFDHALGNGRDGRQGPVMDRRQYHRADV
jgi:hypothetical protein